MPKIVDPEQRRAKIAETVARMIADIGLEKTTMREIAKVSGYSKGIIEHYFDSKEEIVEVALEWANQQFMQRSAQAIAGREGLEAMRIRIENIVPLTEEIHEEWRIRLQFWAMAIADPDLRDLKSQRLINAIDGFHRDLKQARKTGEIRADLPLSETAHHLTYTTSGMSIAALHNPGHFSRRRLRQSISRLVNDLRA